MPALSLRIGLSLVACGLFSVTTYASLYIKTPRGYQSLGGPASEGPFATRAQAEAFLQANFPTWPTSNITGTEDAQSTEIVKPPPTRQELDAADLKEASDDENDKGAAYFKRSDWDGAIKHFKAALELNPDNDDAIYNLKQAQTRAGEERSRRERLAAAWAQERAKERAKQAQEEERIAQQKSQLAAIAKGIREINVPPPILAEDATITFGQVAPEDKASKNIILGTEVGIAVLDLYGSIGDSPLNLTPTKLIFVAGKTFIAAENGADVYLTRQNDTYEKALGYLKDKASRQAFTDIVRAIKESRAIPENANIDMVRAAQAILDPKLGNSGKRIAWDALFSPEARNSALTQVGLELGGEVIGQVGEKLVAKIMLQRAPAFAQATEYLTKAASILQQVSEPEAREAATGLLKQANEKIAQIYHARQAAPVGSGKVVSIFGEPIEKK